MTEQSLDELVTRRLDENVSTNLERIEALKAQLEAAEAERDAQHDAAAEWQATAIACEDTYRQRLEAAEGELRRRDGYAFSCDLKEACVNWHEALLEEKCCQNWTDPQTVPELRAQLEAAVRERDEARAEMQRRLDSAATVMTYRQRKLRSDKPESLSAFEALSLAQASDALLRRIEPHVQRFVENLDYEDECEAWLSEVRTHLSDGAKAEETDATAT